MARTGKFLIKTGRGHKTHFVLVATNGRVVATFNYTAGSATFAP